MIKYILSRKREFRYKSNEELDAIMSLYGRYYTIYYLIFSLCFLTSLALFVTMFVSVLPNINWHNWLNDRALMYLISLCVVYILFCIALKISLEALIVPRVYPRLTIAKGKALSKQQLKVIKKSDIKLYKDILSISILNVITNWRVYVCFRILSILKCGELEFLAIRNYNSKNLERTYSIHTLYVNNGWAFDPLSVRQYPLKKFHEIMWANVYRTYTFEDIKEKSFEEFKEEVIPELNDWCDFYNSTYWNKN